MDKKWFYWMVFAIIFAVKIAGQNTLHPKVEWKQLDFNFPNNSERERALRENQFIPENCLPLDMDVHNTREKQRIFVTVPRFTDGVPITLGTISNINSTNGPLIEPYPSYSWHNSSGTDCDGITSVFRIFIDQCDRLWVIDAGQVNGEWKCRPQLLAFDLKTDKLIRRYRIPESQVQNDTILVTAIVDVLNSKSNGNCDETKVYIADTGNYSLIVYDYKSNRSWRTTHQTFQPTPGYTNFTIEGESFQFEDGLLGMAISKNPFRFKGYGNSNQSCHSRFLYYHSLASVFENAVPLCTLNDEKAFTVNASANSNAFRVIGNRGVQSAAEAIDSKGNVFFGLVNPPAIACWDTSSDYKVDNLKIIARNRQTLQFASGVKVIRHFRGQEQLWVLTNRLQKFVAGTYNWNETNFRILARPINEILKGQSCVGETITSNFVFPDV